MAQIAFAFVLLAGAGLLLTSFRQLLNVQPGFRTDGISDGFAYRKRRALNTLGDPELRLLADRALQAVRGIPGVNSAGATTTIPFSGDHSDSVIFAEGYAMKQGESAISPRQIIVTPGYFETMGMSLVRGRAFDQRDTESSLPAVIVDEQLARRFWPDRDPVGRRMFQPQNINDLLKTDEHTRWLTVVGVVRNIRLDNLEGEGTPVGVYYFPWSQSPQRGLTFAIRTSAGAGSVSPELRSTISRVDPGLALFSVRTMEEWAALSLSTRKTSMLLALGFGGLALILSAIGIYGVLTYLVTQRRREIGIRTALGCSASGIVRVVLSEGLVLVGIGLGAGVAGAVVFRKALVSELYGVQPLDPLVMSSAIAVLGLVALAASLFPARRATQVDPMIVLNEL